MAAHQLVADVLHDLVLGGLVNAVDLLLNGLGILLRHSLQGEHVVVDQLVVGVLDGDHTLGGVHPDVGIQIFVDQLCGQNTRQLLLDQLIDTDLQVLVYGQIDIVSGLGVRLLDDLPWASHVVHVHPGKTLLALQLQLQGFLDAGPANHVV